MQHRKLSKNVHLFSLQHFKKLTEMKRSKNGALRDSPLLLATVLSLSLSLMVNRWLVLINGCLPTLLNTNVRYQAGVWPSRVNSSEHYTVSTPLCDSISSVIAHQLITTAIHLHCFYSCCCLWHLLFFFKGHLLMLVSDQKLHL